MTHQLLESFMTRYLRIAAEDIVVQSTASMAGMQVSGASDRGRASRRRVRPRTHCEVVSARRDRLCLVGPSCRWIDRPMTSVL